LEVERKRDRYQEIFAADTMTLGELKAKLDALEETCETARRRLAVLASWHESLEALERDMDRLLESYALRVRRRRWPPWTPRSAARYTLYSDFASRLYQTRA
jgi:hypothetical protein